MFIIPQYSFQMCWLAIFTISNLVPTQIDNIDFRVIATSR